MVVLSLYHLGLSIKETYDLFTQLSGRIFRGRSPVGIGLLAAAYALIASYRHGQFPAGDIDGALSDLLGDSTMLDHPYMSSIGARIGFPVVNADTLETCMVTSYNGAAKAYDGSDCNDSVTYRVLQSDDASNEIQVKDG